MSTAPRKAAPRLAKPAARYWKGKAPKGVAAEVESDSEEEQEEGEEEQEGDVLIDDVEKGADEDEEDEDLPTGQTRAAPTKAINVALQDIDLSKETREKRDAAMKQEESEEESEEEEEAQGEEEEDDSSEEESSEEDEPAKPQFRPVFVSKRNRVTVSEKDEIAGNTEEAIAKREADAAERKKQSHDIAAETIRRELLEKEKEEEAPDVDDIDGLDAEAEFEAWKLRELGRIKRDKENETRREEEREEVERRRALPEAQRMKEDLERAQKLREEKPKGQQKFLQKYWHKGAFHQDEEILQRHDFTEATESTMDVSMLPKVMQVRNFGKRSRTKYTHLLDQDTSAANGGFGAAGAAPKPGSSSSGCFICGGPHLKKDCPQNTGEWNATKGRAGTGANNHETGGGSREWGAPRRQWRDEPEDEGGRDRGGWGGRDRDGGDRRPRYRDERSRSPRRRSRSPDRRREPRSPPRRREYRRRTVKVAIVGTGLAGLTAAYLLTKHADEDADVVFDVHVFDKTNTLGMDSSSISLPIPGEEDTWRIDVPMRSFQGGYYPQLIALYRKLGVAFVARDFTYSFSWLAGQAQSRSITADMIYNGANGAKGVDMPAKLLDAHNQSAFLFGKMFIWISSRVFFAFWVLQVACCYIRLVWLSIPFVRPKRIETMSYATWVNRTIPASALSRWTGFDRAWHDFTTAVLIPMFSGVCTAPEEEIRNHPVEELLDYIWLSLGTHHYLVKNGVRDVVQRLTTSIKNVHLSSPITSLEPDPANPELASIQCSTNSGFTTYSGFHHIIFATQSNRCVPLLKSYALALPADQALRRHAVLQQIACLDKFTYAAAIVVNHTDETLLPDDPRDHRELNFVTAPDGPAFVPPAVGGKQARCVPPSYTMTTQILPRPAGFPAHLPRVFQTTNPVVEPREGRILSVAYLERAVLNLDAKEALKGLYKRVPSRVPGWKAKERLGALQGAGKTRTGGPGIWMCGAYAYHGIPLLEGCVVSARLVVEQGVLRSEGISPREVPW
ncbi:hypothetical protein CYLTODRAFT_437293 [Cylindrobasidium torrendii FP15055 ss-10]|uniref:Micro-fibrillar-associated protein 1 C-terminal domain-containing protein n=1 Tax=Cylindrobasidium torrendii FP15055 ss-10 TaxID=1314674 RepID=A0A0D7B9C3_9AGAR|nr:hypothetical protein CYLTODRAFT_437293 [Cylindrobasidium torrendii FP15055 ss-10]